MLKKVRNTIEKYGLLEKGDGVLIGLSGGADSVCLTHMLYTLRDELGIKIYTAHMNHCLRGESADRDERFAVSFSESLGIECITLRQNVRDYAKKRGVSEETAGRELRYAFFERIKSEYGLNKIATAHNRNDNAETVLMDFVRGSGLSGLCGIPIRRGDIIRPVMELSREEIEGYCAENGLEYVTDATNNETVYTRNKIRLELIPALQRDFNPNFTETVTRNAALLCEELDFIESKAEEAYKNVVNGIIELEALNGFHIAIRRRVIIKMMKASGIRDISSEYVENILSLANKGKSGSSVNLPGKNTAEIEYGRLFVGRAAEETEPFEYTLPLDEAVYIKELGVTARAELSEERDIFACDVGAEIVIRSRRAGDCFYPVGMDGKKKLKDYFIDEKIPRRERSKTGVLTIDGKIAWIVGKRRDRRFAGSGKGIKIILQ